MSRPALPDFTDSAAAAAEWAVCAPLLAAAGMMRVGVWRAGRLQYPASAQRVLTADRPERPAAVMLWNDDRRLPVLALDFDAKKGHGPISTERDARDALMLLTDAGLAPVADRGPTGGWHVYARLPGSVAVWQVRQVAAALSARWATLDASMLTNPEGGCIRPPGAAHATGGFQRLIGPVENAAAALAATPPADAWRRLRDRTGAARIIVEPNSTGPEPSRAEVYAPVVGLRRREIKPGADQLARTGQHPDRGFPSPSEARYSVVMTAAWAGWSLHEIEAALAGHWRWLRDSYATKGPKQLARDWEKAKTTVTDVIAEGAASSVTQDFLIHGGATCRPAPPWLRDVHLRISKFATYCRDHQRRHHHSASKRAVMEALLWAGQAQRRLWVSMGVRSLAEACGVNYRTVARRLHELAEDGLITRRSTGRGREADLWALNVDLGEHCKPAQGRRQGLRIVFRTLGSHRTGEVYETLVEAAHALQTGEIAALLGYDRRRIGEELAVLAGWGLAHHTRHIGWTVGSADPDQLAHRLGGWADWRAQHEAHQRDRAAWRAWLDRHSPAIDPGQLLLDELEHALATDEDTWIQQHAAGLEPPLETGAYVVS